MDAAFERLDEDLGANVGVANAVGVNVTRVEVELDMVKVGQTAQALGGKVRSTHPTLPCRQSCRKRSQLACHSEKQWLARTSSSHR